MPKPFAVAAVTEPDIADPLHSLVLALAKHHGLTHREADVVLETLRGKGVKEVAFAMGCSKASVYTYWSRILGRAKLPTRERFLAHVVNFALARDP